MIAIRVYGPGAGSELVTIANPGNVHITALRALAYYQVHRLRAPVTPDTTKVCLNTKIEFDLRQSRELRI